MSWFDKLAQEILEEAETLEDLKDNREYDIRLQRVIQRGMAVGLFLSERITAHELKEHIDLIDRDLPRR